VAALLGALAAPAWTPAFGKPAPAAATTDTVTIFGTKVPVSEKESTTSAEVLDAARLEQLGAVELKDVLERVGNAGLTTVGSGRFEQFTIRGVPSAGVTPSATPVATLYLDGAPIPDEIYNSAVSNAWDVAQFELLRGAQSTLLGRNSLIGAIYVRTQDPTFEGSLRGRAALGSFGARELSIAGGHALVADRLAFRLVGQSTTSDGAVKRADGSPADERRAGTVRGKLLWQAGRDLSVNAMLMHTDDRRGSALVDAARTGDRVQTTNIAARTDRRLTVGSLRAEWALSPVLTLSSLTTFARGTNTDTSDFDGLADLGNPVVDPIRREKRELHDRTQEFLLRHEGRGAFSGVAGLYLSSRGSEQDPVVEQVSPIPTVPLSQLRALFGAPADLTDVYTQFGFAGVPTGAPDLLSDARLLGPGFESRFTGRFENDFATRALFAEGKWKLGRGLTAIGGLRWEREEARFVISQLNELLDPNDLATLGGSNVALIQAVAQAIAPGYATSICPLAIPGVKPALDLPTCAGAIVQQGYAPLVGGVLTQFVGENFFAPASLANERSFSVLLPKLGLTWELSADTAVSLVAQRAFRAGGLGVNPVRASIFAFEPEYSTNTELALRTRSRDGTFVLNANLFHIDWKDQQLEVVRSGTFQDTETVNVGRSRLTGLELGLRARLAPAWGAFASIAFLDTKVTRDDRTAEELAGQPNLAGSRFPFAPRSSGNLGLNYGAGARGANATVDMSWQGQSEALLPNSVKNGSRTVLNLRAGWNAGAWQVNAFARNLLDRTYFVNAAAAGTHVVLGEPRSVGASLTAQF
jgi:outer membrane receptor protein involved in Fe transport